MKRAFDLLAVLTISPLAVAAAAAVALSATTAIRMPAAVAVAPVSSYFVIQSRLSLRLKLLL